MKKALLVILFVLSAQYVYASEEGRYQTVSIPKDANSVSADRIFIIDTKEGHMWLWVEFPVVSNVSEGGRILIYQGKVKPGKKMGDIIEKQQFK